MPWPDIHEMPNADLIPVLIGDHTPDPPAHIKRVVSVPLDDPKPVTFAQAPRWRASRGGHMVFHVPVRSMR